MEAARFDSHPNVKGATDQLCMIASEAEISGLT